MGRTLQTTCVIGVGLIAGAMHRAFDILDAWDHVTTMLNFPDPIAFIAAHPIIMVDYVPAFLASSAALTLAYIWVWPLVRDWFAPIRINFDVANPNENYWRRAPHTTIIDEYDIPLTLQGLQYRAQLHVNSRATVEGVHAFVELDGNHISNAAFSRNGAEKMDMPPESSEFIDVYWLPYKGPLDSFMLNLLPHHKPMHLTLLVRGKGMREIRKRFRYDRHSIPAITPA